MGRGNPVDEAYYDPGKHNYNAQNPDGSVNSLILQKIQGLRKFQANEVPAALKRDSSGRALSPLFYCPNCGAPLAHHEDSKHVYFYLRNSNATHTPNYCRYWRPKEVIPVWEESEARTIESGVTWNVPVPQSSPVLTGKKAQAQNSPVANNNSAPPTIPQAHPGTVKQRVKVVGPVRNISNLVTLFSLKRDLGSSTFIQNKSAIYQQLLDAQVLYEIYDFDILRAQLAALVDNTCNTNAKQVKKAFFVTGYITKNSFYPKNKDIALTQSNIDFKKIKLLDRAGNRRIMLFPEAVLNKQILIDMWNELIKLKTMKLYVGCYVTPNSWYVHLSSDSNLYSLNLFDIGWYKRYGL